MDLSLHLKLQLSGWTGFMSHLKLSKWAVDDDLEDTQWSAGVCSHAISIQILRKRNVKKFPRFVYKVSHLIAAQFYKDINSYTDCSFAELSRTEHQPPKCEPKWLTFGVLMRTELTETFTTGPLAPKENSDPFFSPQYN